MGLTVRGGFAEPLHVSDALSFHQIQPEARSLRAALLQLPLEFCLGLTLLHRQLLLTKGLLLFELALQQDLAVLLLALLLDLCPLQLLPQFRIPRPQPA